ncbi:Insect cuticle protein [Cinara cedri]|uniref:Insect cuticle protein n=1 Tax=Cinara cedri TaxID=506608 RepID=A0A5E4M2B0_9HEMI|nr:Insect cuticle protein [Cinara cedri]
MMNSFKVFTALAAFCVCGALAAPAGQPIPILKQVNRQNEDGSYSYGYESADGSFKIETKYPTGEVYGKYGYVDEETGKLRTVEYGASSRGFEPVGTGITVPPPVTGVDSNDLHHNREHQSQDDYDDGQYREDPSVYYKSEQQPFHQTAPVARHHQPQQQQQWFAAANGGQKARSDNRQFQAHPSVHNFDPMSGSFSISYTGRK